ncbi:MAG: 50S ribosomal protein L15 [Chitinivibrionales bacterium]|nr:50S ribosomal protein L15 [Chitinivibrionales bacterium]
MTLNTLQPAKGARKRKKRVGRGQGSGQGCTAGYGMNGAKARSGRKHKPYFEGGQTPLTRRIPKRGFSNRFKKECQIVNVGDIHKALNSEQEIDIAWLFDNKLIRDTSIPVKILGNGEFSKEVTIYAHGFSQSAKEKIEQANGKAEAI